MASTDDIKHLLRRAEFTARPNRISALTPLTIAQAVDNVLDTAQNGATPLPPNLANIEDEGSWEDYVNAYNWWVDSMVSRPRPILEKMTLFWHGHFVSSVDDVYVVHMIQQNQLYRDYALGNFLTLTQKMALEPAMLLYLSNAVNYKKSPNENFARELLELFTLGVGNYTQDDVFAAARAWTGHNYNWELEAYVFNPKQHDTGLKTFFGTTKNWDGPDIINEILRDNAGKRLIAAKYIAKKLWEFFAYPGPAQVIVDDLANEFIANNLEIKPLLRALFNRSEFYTTAAKQGLVRTPTDFVVDILYRTGLKADDLGLSWSMGYTGQQLFSPPNVAGWKSNSYWINTSSLSGRAGIARSVIWQVFQDGAFDAVDDMTVEQAVDHIAQYFGLDLSSVTRTALINTLRAERQSTPWGSWQATPNLLTMMMCSPEMSMA